MCAIVLNLEQPDNQHGSGSINSLGTHANKGCSTYSLINFTIFRFSVNILSSISKISKYLNEDTILYTLKSRLSFGFYNMNFSIFKILVYVKFKFHPKSDIIDIITTFNSKFK